MVIVGASLSVMVLYGDLMTGCGSYGALQDSY